MYHNIFVLVGTECHVLESRPKDFNTQGLKRWTFTVLAFWGEPPKGHFVIDIFDTVNTFYNKKICCINVDKCCRAHLNACCK